MTEQVSKSFEATFLVPSVMGGKAIQSGRVVHESDYDALHQQVDAMNRSRTWAETELPKWQRLAAETRIERDDARMQIEGLRAENERLSESAKTWGRNCAQATQESRSLRAELEAARGLLRDAKEGLDDHWVTTGEGEATVARIDAFLTATPAPEVRHAKHCLLLDPEEPESHCTCYPVMAISDERSREVAKRGRDAIVGVKKGERQEPVGYGAWNTGTNPGTRLMRYDGMVAINPTKTDFYTVPVYATPQSAPDFSALVEALRTVVGLMHHKATTPLEQESLRMADKALATYRKQAGK